MKIPKTFKGKLLLLLQIAELEAENEKVDESIFFNDIIGAIQNRLGDTDGSEILGRYGLKWLG